MGLRGWLADRIVVDPDGMGGLAVGRVLAIPWWRRPKDTVTLGPEGFVRYGKTIAWDEIETITVGTEHSFVDGVTVLVIETAETGVAVSDRTERCRELLDGLGTRLGVDRERLERLMSIDHVDEWTVLYRKPGPD